VHERVEALIGRATQDRCVWLLLVDGDRRQTPVVMPLEDFSSTTAGIRRLR
jgi:hypothetical protein